MMLKRFKMWLRETYLPEVARQQLIEENKNQAIELKRLAEQIMALNSYIDGLNEGYRAQRRVIINNNVEKGD